MKQISIGESKEGVQQEQLYRVIIKKLWLTGYDYEVILLESNRAND